MNRWISAKPRRQACAASSRTFVLVMVAATILSIWAVTRPDATLLLLLLGGSIWAIVVGLSHVSLPLFDGEPSSRYSSLAISGALTAACGLIMVLAAGTGSISMIVGGQAVVFGSLMIQFGTELQLAGRTSRAGIARRPA